jgi:serine/threonine-protein kinase HipA
MAEVDVFVNRQLAGRLSRAQMRHGFTYGFDAPEALSLTMPLRLETYIYEQGLHPLFQMNLPEGYLRQAIERAAAKHYGSDDVTFLTLLGNHQIGRLRYTVANNPLPEAALKTPSLDELLNSDDAALFEQLLSRYALQSGVAGVQPKVLMDLRSNDFTAELDNVNPITHKATLPLKKYIVKSWGSEFPQLACNEFFCLSLARNAGLTTPNFYLSNNGKLLICERFDIDEHDEPLGFEDFCVLQGKTTQAKYESSIEACTNTIRQYVSHELQPKAFEDFFKLTLLNIKIQNGDAHLKNFGVLYKNLANYYTGQTPTISRMFAPVFDLVSTTPYIQNDSMALTLTGTKRWPKWKVLERFAKSHCNLSNAKIDQIINDLENACEISKPLLNELVKNHLDFKPIGEKIDALLGKTFR